MTLFIMIVIYDFAKIVILIYLFEKKIYNINNN